VVDSEGFRPNVGIILANDAADLWWGRRVGGRDAWQFPQGGLDSGESTEQAMYRELREEIGLRPDDVEILASTRGWLRYRLPERFIRQNQQPLCIGQKQKWFLLRMRAPDSAVDLEAGDKAEFEDWSWVSYWYPLSRIVAFKREVYRRALRELAPAISRHVERSGGPRP